MDNGAASLVEAVKAAQLKLATSPYPVMVNGYVPAVIGIDDELATAITEHWSAWVNFQIASGREASSRAEEAEADALLALLATPVMDAAGARALIDHLAWFSEEERAFRGTGTRDLNDLPFVLLDTLRIATASAVSAALDAVEARQ